MPPFDRHISDPYNEFIFCNLEVSVFSKCLSLFSAMLLALTFPVTGFSGPGSQTHALAQGNQQPPQINQQPLPEDEEHAKIERDMAKKANQERQAALRHDTDQLLKLSAELKEYVDKSNENLLSVEVIRKAEEIEKLAHRVKDRMKGQ
jgi:hypothetical protein